MAIRSIIPVTDPALRLKSETVRDFDGKLAGLVADLVETMFAAPGAGISAIQVGAPLRVLIADVSDNAYRAGPVTMINPEITIKSGGSISIEEGCLSVPNYFAPVQRAQEVLVRYQDLDGRFFERSFTDVCSIIVQHEVDHLDGIVFLDYLSRLRRDSALRMVRKELRHLRGPKAEAVF